MAPTARDALRRDHEPDKIASRLEDPYRVEYVSDAVLGGIDGCVTTFAIVAGAIGAGVSGTTAVILGFANLIADGFSMAVSNYEAVRAQADFVERSRRDEEHHIDHVPEGEREEIRQIFAGKGFKGDILERIVETVTSDRELWIETMLTEEHGFQKTTRSPLISAWTTFGSFLLVGLAPLLPLLVPGWDQSQKFTGSMVMAGITFFAIGMFKCRVTHRSVLFSGLTTFVMGGVASWLSYAVGSLLRSAFGSG